MTGEYKGHHIDAGLIIHEGQLTYTDQKLELIVDTGKWWHEQTGLPLPLGANASARYSATQRFPMSNAC